MIPPSFYFWRHMNSLFKERRFIFEGSPDVQKDEAPPAAENGKDEKEDGEKNTDVKNPDDVEGQTERQKEYTAGQTSESETKSTGSTIDSGIKSHIQGEVDQLNAKPDENTQSLEEQAKQKKIQELKKELGDIRFDLEGATEGSPAYKDLERREVKIMGQLDELEGRQYSELSTTGARPGSLESTEGVDIGADEGAEELPKDPNIAVLIEALQAFDAGEAEEGAIPGGEALDALTVAYNNLPEEQRGVYLQQVNAEIGRAGLYDYSVVLEGGRLVVEVREPPKTVGAKIMRDFSDLSNALRNAETKAERSNIQIQMFFKFLEGLSAFLMGRWGNSIVKDGVPPPPEGGGNQPPTTPPEGGGDEPPENSSKPKLNAELTKTTEDLANAREKLAQNQQAIQAADKGQKENTQDLEENRTTLSAAREELNSTLDTEENEQKRSELQEKINELEKAITNQEEIDKNYTTLLVSLRKQHGEIEREISRLSKKKTDLEKGLEKNSEAIRMLREMIDELNKVIRESDEFRDLLGGELALSEDPLGIRLSLQEGKIHDWLGKQGGDIVTFEECVGKKQAIDQGIEDLYLDHDWQIT
jgi:tetratricopeptide (TPR) repeat protein